MTVTYDLYRSEAITYENALHHADSLNDLHLMIKLGDEEASESMGSSLEGAVLLIPGKIGEAVVFHCSFQCLYLWVVRASLSTLLSGENNLSGFYSVFNLPL